MSRAFVKESDNEWLGDVAPDVPALERYLTRENGGMKVFEVARRLDETSRRDIHEMSNGNCYTLDEDGRWTVIFD
jgi:hypothetical protein